MRIALILFISISFCIPVGGQTIPSGQQGSGFKISDGSPLKKLSTRDNQVTPASFLQGKDVPAPLPKSSQDQIPSILTGRRNPPANRAGMPPVARVARRQESVDPLKIRSEPIVKKSSASPLNREQSSFQPAGQAPDVGRRGEGTSSPSKTGTLPSSTRIANRENGRGATIGDRSDNSPRVELSPPVTIKNDNGKTNRITNNAIRTSPTPQSSFTTDNTRLPAATSLNTSPRNISTPSSVDRDSNLFSSVKISPQLKVASKGPRSISVNKPDEFEVRISNVGQVDANEVIVGIEVPAWVDVVGKPVASGGVVQIKDLGESRGVIWTVSYLPANQDAFVTLNLMPKENRAFNLKTEWTTAPVSGEEKVMVTQPNLSTRIAGPAEVKYGEKAVYTITIQNSGNGQAEAVEVSLSESLGGDSARVGAIQAGATKQFEVELTAGQAGPLKLEAFVAGDAGVKSEISKEILVRRANLKIAAEGPKFKYAGSALTYNVIVENTGDAPARNIAAASLLPLGAEYISGLSKLVENKGRNVHWNIGEVPAGSKREFIITCLVQQAGEARMEVGIRSEGGLTAGDTVTTKVEALADLTLDVVDPRGPQATGREVVYELHLKNRGTKAAANVLISGEFSDHIEPVAGKGGSSSIEPGMISFAPIERIGVGESVVVKVVAKAFQPGTHTFRAVVECRDQDIRRISEGTTKFFGDAIKAPKRTSGSTRGSTPSAKLPAEANRGLPRRSGNLQPNSAPTTTQPATSLLPANGRPLGASDSFVSPRPASSTPPSLSNDGGTFQPR